MTLDERLELLVKNQERFDRNQEQFERNQERFDRNQEMFAANLAKLEASQAKTETVLAHVLDIAKRLERIAFAHEVRLDDIDAALSRLEARRPQ